MNVNEVIASNLRAMRARARLTQGELGQRVGINQTRIYRIETGRYPISVAELIAIATYYGCHLDDFIRPSPPMTGGAS